MTKVSLPGLIEEQFFVIGDAVVIRNVPYDLSLPYQNSRYSSASGKRAIQHRNPGIVSRFRDDESESSANFSGANYYRSR